MNKDRKNYNDGLDNAPKVRTVKTKLFKIITLFIIGGLVYILMEIMWRGFSHWTMFILGGICFLIIGAINEYTGKDTPLLPQMLLGAVVITSLEFITGCIVNLHLGWNVWDYSDKCGNILGQICPAASILWFFISLIAITLDDYLRYLLWNEDKPKYTIL